MVFVSRCPTSSPEPVWGVFHPKSFVLGDVNGMRGHIDAVSRGDIFFAGWHRAQVCYLFPQQCLWTQFMTDGGQVEAMADILFLDQLVNLYVTYIHVEPITL